MPALSERSDHQQARRVDLRMSARDVGHPGQALHQVRCWAMVRGDVAEADQGSERVQGLPSRSFDAHSEAHWPHSVQGLPQLPLRPLRGNQGLAQVHRMRSREASLRPQGY